MEIQGNIKGRPRAIGGRCPVSSTKSVRQAKELKVALRALGFEPKKEELKKLVCRVLHFSPFVIGISSALPTNMAPVGRYLEDEFTFVDPPLSCHVSRREGIGFVLTCLVSICLELCLCACARAYFERTLTLVMVGLQGDQEESHHSASPGAPYCCTWV